MSLSRELFYFNGENIEELLAFNPNTYINGLDVVTETLFGPTRVPPKVHLLKDIDGCYFLVDNRIYDELIKGKDHL